MCVFWKIKITKIFHNFCQILQILIILYLGIPRDLLIFEIFVVFDVKILTIFDDFWSLFDVFVDFWHFWVEIWSKSSSRQSQKRTDIKNLRLFTNFQKFTIFVNFGIFKMPVFMSKITPKFQKMAKMTVFDIFGQILSFLAIFDISGKVREGPWRGLNPQICSQFP